jgi:hypothetical protein
MTSTFRSGAAVRAVGTSRLGRVTSTLRDGTSRLGRMTSTFFDDVTGRSVFGTSRLGRITSTRGLDRSGRAAGVSLRATLRDE